MNFNYTQSMSIFFTRGSLLNMLWMFIFFGLLATPYFYEIHVFQIFRLHLFFSTSLITVDTKNIFSFQCFELEKQALNNFDESTFLMREPLIEIDKYGLQFQYLAFSIHLHNENNASNVHKSLCCKHI